MVSCKISFLWINGELLVRISFGVLMERFLWELLVRESLVWISWACVEDIFLERWDQEDLMDALKFRQVWDHYGEILRITEKPYFGAYTGCLCRLSVYREHIVDKIMEICGWANDKLLNTEAGSISAFYGLISVIETLVWLHYSLDG